LFLWEKGHLIRQGTYTEMPCLSSYNLLKMHMHIFTCKFEIPNPGRQNFFDHHLSCNPQKLTLRPPMQRTPQWRTTWKLIRFSSLWISGRKCD
jgi:hypothetical protein